MSATDPARSQGAAAYVGGNALAQLGLLLIVPSAAGALAPWLVRDKVLDA